MKYPSTKESKTLNKSLAFSGGINKAVNPNEILNDQLQDSTNIISKNGVVSTRKGILPNLQTVIGQYDNTGSFKKALTITETEIYIDNSPNKIAYSVWGNNSYESIHLYIISSKGEITELSTITPANISNRFYKTDNVFFLVEKKTHSNGIYAFVKRSCFYDSSYHYAYEIYEYDTDQRTSRKLTNSDYYAPIIYINGRGNNYETAKKESTVYSASPACPEELNLLGGKFKAYFTSDGYSSSFKLPISGLDFNYGVVCRIYLDTNSYSEWTVPANSFEATTTFNGLQIKINVDRTSGKFSFWNGNTRYSIPKTGIPNGNDICFTGTKELDTANKIIGSKSVYLHGSTYFVYGNEITKNNVFASKFSMPLYFPETMVSEIGNATDEITAIINLGSDLLAYKADGIYKITSTSESGKLSYISPVGITTDFVKPSTLSNSIITQFSGSDNKNTVCHCGNSIVSLKNKKIYAFTGSNKVNEISKPIENILLTLSDNEIKNAFAASFDGLYYLFFGTKALVLNYENDNFGISEKYTANNENSKNVSWFYLDFPSNAEYLGAVSLENQMLLICGDTQSKIDYLCAFSGEKDIIIDASNTTSFGESRDINFIVSTKVHDFDNSGLKNIVALNLQMSGSSLISIDITGDNYTSTQGIRLKNNNISVIKVLPFFMPIKNMSFSLSGKAPFTLEKANIEYKLI